MAYPFDREFQVLLAPFVGFGASSIELDLLSMGITTNIKLFTCQFAVLIMSP